MKRTRVILTILLLTILLLLLGTSVQATNLGIYTLEDGYVTRILPDTIITDLKSNLLTEENVVIKDKTGSIVEENDIVKTGMTLEIGGTQYKISVVGDLSGDGKISITDVVQSQLHVTNIKRLEGEREKSADINGDGKKSITDLVQLKLVQVNIKDIAEYVKYTDRLEELLQGMLKKEYKPDEDEDKDGLTNAEEEVLGTNIHSVDTDADGLTDYYEVNVSKTRPIKGRYRRRRNK